MKAINNAPRQNCERGSYTPYAFNNEGTIRYDTYKPYDSQTSFTEATETVLCLNSHDLSPVKVTPPTLSEMGKCHSCFTGYPHTIALCQKRQEATT